MKYISVSKILNKIWPFDDRFIDDHVLLKAITKGDCIHNQLENYIKSNYIQFPNCECVEPLSNHNQMPVMLVPYLIELRELGHLKPEYPIMNSKYMVRGKIDLLVEHWDLDDDKFSIIDWKTNSSADKKKWRIQLNIYHWLISGRWNLLPGEKLQVIHINNETNKDGKPKLNKEGWKIIDFSPLNEMEIAYIYEIIKELRQEAGNEPKQIEGN